MGVCLEFMFGYERNGSKGNYFDVDALISTDKELSPIYESFWDLDGKTMNFLNAPHSDEVIKTSGYGDLFQTYAVEQILEIIEDNITSLLEVPDKVYTGNGDRKGTPKDARYWDYRVQALIGLLKTYPKDSRILLYWS